MLWEIELDAGTTGSAMTYVHEGRQYIVMPTGSRQHSAEFVTLSLP